MNKVSTDLSVMSYTSAKAVHSDYKNLLTIGTDAGYMINPAAHKSGCCMSVLVPDVTPLFFRGNIGLIDIGAKIGNAIEFMRTLNASDSVLFHCQYGISRSAAFAVLYLMIHYGMSRQDATRYIVEQFPRCKPNWYITAIGEAIIDECG